MNYSYVKANGESYEFIPDEGYTFNDVVYNTQFLNASDQAFLSSIGLYKTVLLPNLPNSLEPDGTYYFNLRYDGIVEYRPNYTIGIRVPQTLTPRQIRMVLTANNLRQAVEDAVLASTDYNLKDWWEYSLEYERNHEKLISMATQLGLIDAQVDQMFIDGSKL